MREAGKKALGREWDCERASKGGTAEAGESRVGERKARDREERRGERERERAASGRVRGEERQKEKTKRMRRDGGKKIPCVTWRDRMQVLCTGKTHRRPLKHFTCVDVLKPRQ